MNSHWGQWSVSTSSWLALKVSISGIDFCLYVLHVIIPLLPLPRGDELCWVSASSSCLLGWKWGRCWLAKRIAALFSLCVNNLFALGFVLLFFFLFHPPSLYLLSLLCHSCRAITGIHASTASIRQHDHVSEEGTLRGHGFCRGWTRWHHRSQWRRGGVWLCLYLCVTLSGKQTLASCFSPMNLCSSS